MKNIINEDFYNFCYKDITEMFDIVNPLISEINDLQIDSEYYYNSDDKIISYKPVYNEYNDEIGKRIDVILIDKQKSYKLEYKDDNEVISLELERQCHENNDFIMKSIEVSIEDAHINRCFMYEVNGRVLYYDLGYEISTEEEYEEYLKSESLESILDSLKPNKLRKR